MIKRQSGHAKQLRLVLVMATAATSPVWGAAGVASAAPPPPATVQWTTQERA